MAFDRDRRRLTWTETVGLSLCVALLAGVVAWRSCSRTPDAPAVEKTESHPGSQDTAKCHPKPEKPAKKPKHKKKKAGRRVTPAPPARDPLDDRVS